MGMAAVDVIRKRQLAERLSAKTGAKLKVSVAIVDFILDEIASSMAKGVKVNLKDFGIFVKAERAARMGRNPATGAQIKIKASVKPRFRPSKVLKDAMASKKYALHADVAALESCACAAKPAAKAVKAAPAKAAAKKAPAKKKASPKRR